MLPKHCSSHDHYTDGCDPCRRAYAIFKSGNEVKQELPQAKRVPGKGYEILDDILMYKDVKLNDLILEKKSGNNLGGGGMKKHTQEELDRLSVPELRKLCSQEGITKIQGMPVSNCKRDALEAALKGEIPGGQGDQLQQGGDDGEMNFGPKEGKGEMQELPPQMKPLADTILKSKDFEDAVREADVMGDIKKVLVSHKAGLNLTMNTVSSLSRDMAALKEKGIEGGKITVEYKEGQKPLEIKEDEIPNSPILKRVIEHLANREHVALVGPAGSGKSTIVRLACKALGAELFHTPCGGDIREQHLLGRIIPIGEKQEWTYIPAPFVTAFESKTPSVSLLDEMDGVSDPSVLLPINDVLAGFDKLALPWRFNDPYATRGEGFLGVAATMNTIGSGATALYQGRTALDGSTLDRFVGRIIICGYDDKWEAAYVKAAEAKNGEELLTLIRGWRKVVEKNNLRRIVSTRMLQQGIAMLRRGWELLDVKRALLTGWSPDDLAAIKETL